MKYSVYIARLEDNSLYVGSTSVEPIKRIQRHNIGQGAKWFIDHGKGRLVYSEYFVTNVEARRREVQIKKWSPLKKERLIAGLKP